MAFSKLRLFVAGCLVASCATHHERRGDEAVKAGFPDDAVRAYAEALTDRPLVDFEYERIRDKRLRIVEGKDAPDFEHLRLRRASTPPLAYARALIDFRAKARENQTSGALNARMEQELVDATRPSVLAIETPPRALAHLDELLALYDRAHQTSAPSEGLEQLADAMRLTLEKALPPPNPTEQLAEFDRLVQAREALRQRHLPAALDPPIDEALFRIVELGDPAISEAEAHASFTRAAALRLRAAAVQAPSSTVDWLSRLIDRTSYPIRAEVHADAKAGRYFKAIAWQQNLIHAFAADHVVQKELDRLRDEGARHHRALAAQAPKRSFAEFVHLAFAATLSQNPEELRTVEKLKQTLKPTWASDYDFRPRVGGRCAALADSLSSGLRLNPNDGAFDIDIDAEGCDARDHVSSRRDSVRYTYEEQYQVKERQQVGTAIERTPHTTKYQCSRPSSLGPEYRWEGLCERTDYTEKVVPVYEDVLVTKIRDAEDSYSYVVDIRGADGQTNATASLRWSDGTLLQTHADDASSVRYEAWGYSLPPRRLGEARRQSGQSFPPGDYKQTALTQAAFATSRKLRQSLLEKVRAHRAYLAEVEGEAARRAGHEFGADDAFARSVLHDAKTGPKAGAWFEAKYGLPADELTALFDAKSKRWSEVGHLDLPSPAAWAPDPLKSRDDGFARKLNAYEADTADVSGYSLAGGISHGAEVFRFDIGLYPYHVVGDDGVSRAGVPLGFEYQFGPLAYLFTPGWGFALLDEIGLKLGYGLHFMGKRKYDTDGGTETESASTWLVNPEYTLMAGVRLAYVSLFAGARVGWLLHSHGDARTSSFHVEYAARIALRFWGPRQLIIQTYGGPPLMPGVPGREGGYVSFPLGGRDSFWGLILKWERTKMDSTHLTPDGETRVPAGQMRLDTFGLAVEIRG